MNKNKFKSDLSTLVKFETVKGNTAAFDQALNFIQSKLNNQAIITQLGEGASRILIASNTTTKNPDICFLAHVDVVPADPKQYTLTCKDDLLFGRGVSDMKFSIPIGYYLLNTIIEQNFPVTFALVITCDEESGGFQGAKYLVDEYKLKPKLMIVPDGGDNFLLINKSKGVCQLKISMNGISAHASRPWLGTNALIPLIKLAAGLNEKYESSNKTSGWKTTMNIGSLKGGDNPNRVADRAVMYVDFRFPFPENSVEDILTEVKRLAQAIDPNIRIEKYAIGDATYMEETSPILKLFAQSFKTITHKSIKISGAHGSSDVRHFNKLGIPFIMTKPVGGDIHGPNEHISLMSCIQYYEVMLNFIKKLADSKVLK